MDGEGRALAAGTGVGVGVGVGVGDPVGLTATGLVAGRTGPAARRGSTRVVVMAATPSSTPTTMSTARRGREPNRGASRPADPSLTPSPPHGIVPGLCHWLRDADQRGPHSYDAGTGVDVTPSPGEGGHQHDEQQRHRSGSPFVRRDRSAHVVRWPCGCQMTFANTRPPQDAVTVTGATSGSAGSRKSDPPGRSGTTQLAKAVGSCPVLRQHAGAEPLATCHVPSVPCST